MKKSLCLVMSVALLSGCAANEKIVIPSYAAPAEYQKIESLKHGNDTAKGAYLSFAVNPEANRFPSETTADEQTALSRNLVTETLAQITETRFITIEPIYELSTVKLDMAVDAFTFEQTDNKRKGMLKTTFTLAKGTTPVLIKTYSEKELRYSKSGQDLPSKEDIMAALAKGVVAKFIADISPTKTNQLREFLALPSGLSKVTTMAKRGNYESAIAEMEGFNGNKDMAYHYNLAILYEGLASEREDVKLADKAMQAYQAATANGGDNNPLVTDAKSRFENFYRLLTQIKSQQKSNQQLEKSLDQQFLR